MKIIVCVKQAAHIYIQNGYDQETKGIVSEGLVHTINPYDEVAVEEGLRLKEKGGKGSVTVVTIGPERAESTLRWCLAMGADNVIHVVQESEEDLDPWQRASVLVEVIRQNGAPRLNPWSSPRREGRHHAEADDESIPSRTSTGSPAKADGVDLLLFGKKAIDDQMGQVGIFVAELLGLPVVTAVAHIVSLDSERTTVHRVLERGNREEVISPVPLVLTVDKSLNRPRYPTFPAMKWAKKKPVKKIPLSSFAVAAGENKIKTERLAPPRIRPKKILSPDSSLSAFARMNFVTTGGMGQKKGETVGGDPKQMVSGIIDFLKEKQVID